MWISSAPESYSRLMVSRSCVPRTIESSQKRMRLPAISSRMGISFMRATRSRTSWCWGMKLRAQVGEYLTKGRLKGRPASVA